jgi:hypothetical protein
MIQLHLVSPSGFNHNIINGALDEIEASAYYLYFSQSSGLGKRYWFYTKPNINILINQAKNDITDDAIHAEIIRRVKDNIQSVKLFNVLADPSRDMPEQTRLTLALLHPRYITNFDTVDAAMSAVIEPIATKRGASERLYRNTILFMVCSEIGVNKLRSDVRHCLACQKISFDYHSQLEREQRDELKRKRRPIANAL